MKTKTLIIILGPTAIGKTSISIKLAKHYNTQIISADSRQFYKELKIGAAPPSKEELSEVQHHFIHNLSVNEDYNVGKFEEDALRKIEELFKEKEKIIMVGGSGLYIDAICKGFDKMPDISKEIRNRVISLYKEKGIKFLQSELKENDPIYFNEVDIQNPQRLMRAIEVIYSTSKPFSNFRKEQVKKRSFNIVKIGLDMNREDLYKRINKRVDIMIENGLLDEVGSLLNHRNKNSLQTVGYKELFEYLDGKYSQEEVIDMIKQNTRRFAKRQISWFKRDHKITYFSTNKTKEIIKFIG
ncbi:MAG: tRNA (adenosine(37)-N6)-dimethylallyltransferase MiaA [Flavobacteriales bacterium]|nr:tRNA (adenosine(37)-N6)-dimethylallyltransferase MiaA [Flavobacteriales bacterium]